MKSKSIWNKIPKRFRERLVDHMMSQGRATCRLEAKLILRINTRLFDVFDHNATPEGSSAWWLLWYHQRNL